MNTTEPCAHPDPTATAHVDTQAPADSSALAGLLIGATVGYCPACGELVGTLTIRPRRATSPTYMSAPVTLRRQDTVVRR